MQQIWPGSGAGLRWPLPQRTWLTSEENFEIAASQIQAADVGRCAGGDRRLQPMIMRGALACLLAGAALGVASCGGNSDQPAAAEPATTGFSPEQQSSIEEALDSLAEREKQIFPSFTPAQQAGYREAFRLCTGFWEDYNYTAITDYVIERDNDGLATVGHAEATGCSDANADDPLPGSGFSRRHP